MKANIINVSRHDGTNVKNGSAYKLLRTKHISNATNETKSMRQGRIFVKISINVDYNTLSFTNNDYLKLTR